MLGDLTQEVQLICIFLNAKVGDNARSILLGAFVDGRSIICSSRKLLSGKETQVNLQVDRLALHLVCI